MQPHLTSSLRGTPVRSKTGSPSSSLGTVACRTIAKPQLVLRHCGDRANYHTQERVMEIVSTTTISTELHIPDKMIDINQLACNGFSSEVMGSAATSETALFDVESESSMDSGRGPLPSNYHEGLTLPPSVLSSGKPTLPTPSNGFSMVDSDLSLERNGMEDSVLPSERPISPSDFLQKNPAASSQLQNLDSEMPSDFNNEFDKIFAEMPSDINYDDVQQLDLLLFSLHEKPDTLNSIVHELGIVDEMEASEFQYDGDMLDPKEERHIHHEGYEPEIKESHVHCEGDLFNLAVPTIIAQQPSRIQPSNCVGPVRTRQTRRDRRKPVRYRATVTQPLDDEPTIAEEVKVNVNEEDLVASCTTISGTTLTRNNDTKELSNEEKYIKSREQNNLASKRCRQKRKASIKQMEIDLKELGRKNKDLHDKVAQLTSLKEEFKDFVNKVLFQRLVHKIN